MTKQVEKEEQANPYNLKKSWHTGEDKPFESAEGMFFEKPSNEFDESDDIEMAKQEEVAEEKSAPYKKPDYKKRYDDLKKHYDSKLNEFKSREEELLKQAIPEYKAPKTEEELEEFKKQYPDVFEVVETVAHLQSESKAKVLEERLSQLQEREAQMRQEQAEKRLRERHPDFDDVRNSDDFHGWAKEQPDSIQQWIYDNANDADLASRAIDLFKKDIGMDVPAKKTKSSSKQKKSAADMVSTKTTSVEPNQEKVWSEREIAAMSMAEFDKYESEISEAMQQGRIIK
jgi:predicted house-cleaning noncanonical NTP pyrophosphatase (MazG superfamily)